MFLFFVCLFLAYLAYQVIFKLIIPIYRTTRQVRRTFRDMQERMQAQTGEGSPFESTADAKVPKSKVAGDYIEFEEVK